MSVNNYDIMQVNVVYMACIMIKEPKLTLRFRLYLFCKTRSIYSNRAIGKSINPTDCSIKL